MVVSALVVAAAVLLVVAGCAKLRTPGPAAGMIATVFAGKVSGPAAARRVARAAGVVELGAGLATVGVGGRVAVSALAGCYLVLTVVAVRLASGDQRAACGCFGAADGDVGVAHVALDLACLGVAGWAIARPPGPVTALFNSGALTGAILAAQALLLAALGYLSITALPALSAARRAVETP